MLYAAGEPVWFALTNGRARALPHAAFLNPLRVRRQVVNSPTTEQENITATATSATTATTSGTKHSTAVVTNMTSSSRDLTSTLPLQTDTTTTVSVLQTTTENTSSLDVVMVSFIVFTLSSDRPKARSYMNFCPPDSTVYLPMQSAFSKVHIEQLGVSESLVWCEKVTRAFQPPIRGK